MVAREEARRGTLRIGYWDPTADSWGLRSWLKRKITGHKWEKGNFGDLLAYELASKAFPSYSVLNAREGPRLLTVGSIADQARVGDVLAGVGFRRPSQAIRLPDSTVIWGLRGPLSLRLVEALRGPVMGVSFLGDPGLLASQLWPARGFETKQGWLVIPHYRHLSPIAARYRQQLPSDVTLQSPDCSPSEIAHAVRTSEGVISSSLHGLVFAHSFGIPAIPLLPPKGEGTFKYLDYAESIGWKLEFALSLEEALKRRSFEKVPNVNGVAKSVTLPPDSFLRNSGILLR